MLYDVYQYCNRQITSHCHKVNSLLSAAVYWKYKATAWIISQAYKVLIPTDNCKIGFYENLKIFLSAFAVIPSDNGRKLENAHMITSQEQ